MGGEGSSVGGWWLFVMGVVVLGGGWSFVSCGWSIVVGDGHLLVEDGRLWVEDGCSWWGFVVC